MSVVLTTRNSITDPVGTDFLNVEIGPPASDRIVALAVSWEGGDITSATIGGVNADLSAYSMFDLAGSCVLYASVPDGTHADVILAFDNPPATLSATCYTITGAQAVALDTGAGAASAGSSATAVLETQQSGCMIAGAFSRAPSEESWSGVYADYASTSSDDQHEHGSDPSTDADDQTEVSPNWADPDGSNSVAAVSFAIMEPRAAPWGVNYANGDHRKTSYVKSISPVAGDFGIVGFSGKAGTSVTALTSGGKAWEELVPHSVVGSDGTMSVWLMHFDGSETDITLTTSAITNAVTFVVYNHTGGGDSEVSVIGTDLPNMTTGASLSIPVTGDTVNDDMVVGVLYNSFDATGSNQYTSTALTGYTESGLVTFYQSNVSTGVGNYHSVGTANGAVSGSMDVAWAGSANTSGVVIRITEPSAGQVVTGDGSISLPAPTLSGSGTVTEAPVVVTGTGAVSLPTLSLSGDGGRTITGTGAVALPPLSLSGNGEREVTGSGSISIPTLDLDGIGGSSGNIFGGGNVDIPLLTVFGTGTRTITGDGGVTIPPHTLSGVGGSTGNVSGDGGVGIPLPTLDGSGIRTITGSGSIGIPSFDLSGSGVANTTITGSGAVGIPIPVLFGMGEVAGATNGFGGVTITTPVLDGTGKRSSTMFGGVTITTPTISGAGAISELEPGAGAITMTTPQISGTGLIERKGQGGVVIPAPTLDGSGTKVVVGSGGITMPTFLLYGAQIIGGIREEEIGGATQSNVLVESSNSGTLNASTNASTLAPSINEGI